MALRLDKSPPKAKAQSDHDDYNWVPGPNDGQTSHVCENSRELQMAIDACGFRKVDDARKPGTDHTKGDLEAVKALWRSIASQGASDADTIVWCQHIAQRIVKIILDAPKNGPRGGLALECIGLLGKRASANIDLRMAIDDFVSEFVLIHDGRYPSRKELQAAMTDRGVLAGAPKYETPTRERQRIKNNGNKLDRAITQLRIKLP